MPFLLLFQLLLHGLEDLKSDVMISEMFIESYR